MLLTDDLKEIIKRTEYLLMLATKLTQHHHGGYTDHDKYLYSTRSKELYRFIKNKMEYGVEKERKEKSIDDAVKERLEFLKRLDQERAVVPDTRGEILTSRVVSYGRN